MRTVELMEESGLESRYFRVGKIILPISSLITLFNSLVLIIISAKNYYAGLLVGFLWLITSLRGFLPLTLIKLMWLKLLLAPETFLVASIVCTFIGLYFEAINYTFSTNIQVCVSYDKHDGHQYLFGNYEHYGSRASYCSSQSDYPKFTSCFCYATISKDSGCRAFANIHSCEPFFQSVSTLLQINIVFMSLSLVTGCIVLVLKCLSKKRYRTLSSEEAEKVDCEVESELTPLSV